MSSLKLIERQKVNQREFQNTYKIVLCHKTEPLILKNNIKYTLLFELQSVYLLPIVQMQRFKVYKAYW